MVETKDAEVVELTANQKVRKLYRAFISRKTGNTNSWTPKDWSIYNTQQEELKKRLHAVYNENRSFEHLNKRSVLLLMTMNLTLRVVPLHVFGIYAKI